MNCKNYGRYPFCKYCRNNGGKCKDFKGEK